MAEDPFEERIAYLGDPVTLLSSGSTDKSHRPNEVMVPYMVVTGILFASLLLGHIHHGE